MLALLLYSLWLVLIVNVLSRHDQKLQQRENTAQRILSAICFFFLGLFFVGFGLEVLSLLKPN